MIKGIGVDIVEVQRIKSLIDRYGDKFIKRVFSDIEIKCCIDRKSAAQSFAARLAAKEAFVKALGTGMVTGMKFHDVYVKTISGRPSIGLSGLCLEMADKMGIEKIHLSLTHEKSYAAAVVILEDHK